MKQITAFLLILVGLCSLHSARAAVEFEALSPSVYEQLQALPKSSFKEKQAMLSALVEKEGAAALPALQVILDGELYHNKETLNQLYRVVDEGKEDVVYDLLSAEPVSDVTKKQLRKVRTNNSLRKAIRGYMASVQLFQGDKSQRLAAIESMLGDMDEDTAALVEQAKAQEESSGVLQMMDVALVIYGAEDGDTEARFAAVPILEGRLEPEARSALLRIANDESEDDNLRLAAKNASAKTAEKVEFYGFVEKVFFGLSLGSVLLLAAIGLAITFGVMGVINMAHGEMIMLGAYTTYAMQQLMPNHLAASLIIAIPAAFLFSGLVGIAIQQGVIRFLTGRPLETLLATFGISLILQQAVRTLVSPQNVQVSAPDFISGSLALNPVLSVTFNRLYILIFSLVVFAVLMYIFKYTSLGLKVRAVSQNRNMARSMGVRTQWIDAMTFGLGSGVAGVAGVALSQLTNVGPNLGQAYIIDSFMVVVFGGVGNLLGTLVGAFSLGVVNKFLEPLTGAVLAKIFVLVFIILFIQKRPKGLFPQKGRAAE